MLLTLNQIVAPLSSFRSKHNPNLTFWRRQNIFELLIQILAVDFNGCFMTNLCWIDERTHNDQRSNGWITWNVLKCWLNCSKRAQVFLSTLRCCMSSCRIISSYRSIDWNHITLLFYLVFFYNVVLSSLVMSSLCFVLFCLFYIILFLCRCCNKNYLNCLIPGVIEAFITLKLKIYAWYINVVITGLQREF